MESIVAHSKLVGIKYTYLFGKEILEPENNLPLVTSVLPYMSMSQEKLQFLRP